VVGIGNRRRPRVRASGGEMFMLAAGTRRQRWYAVIRGVIRNAAGQVGSGTVTYNRG